MDCIRTLRQAQNLIRDEQNWWCATMSPGSSKMCAVEAIDKAMNPYSELNYKTRSYLHKTAELMGYNSAINLNDESKSHASVMTMFNLTIQFLEDGVYK